MLEYRIMGRSRPDNFTACAKLNAHKPLVWRHAIDLNRLARMRNCICDRNIIAHLAVLQRSSAIA